MSAASPVSEEKRLSDEHVARVKEGTRAWNKWRQDNSLLFPDLDGLSPTLGQKQWGETNGGPIKFARAMLRNADLRHACETGFNGGNRLSLQIRWNSYLGFFQNVYPMRLFG